MFISYKELSVLSSTLNGTGRGIGRITYILYAPNGFSFLLIQQRVMPPSVQYDKIAANNQAERIQPMLLALFIHSGAGIKLENFNDYMHAPRASFNFGWVAQAEDLLPFGNCASDDLVWYPIGTK